MASTILFLASDEETNLPRLQDAADWLGVRHYTVSPARLVDLQLSTTFDGELNDTLLHDSARDRAFRLDEIGSVWTRGLDYGPVPEAGSGEALTHFEWRNYFLFLLSTLSDRRWMNPMSSLGIAANRLYQLRVASQIGLRVPRTVVTNRPADARRFLGSVGPGIIKLIGQGRASESADRLLLTQPIDKDDDTAIEHVAQCPCLLQERIDKAVEVRAIVVGEQVFAAAIDPNRNPVMAIDTRLCVSTDEVHYAARLPEAVERQLVQLNKILGLEYSAIDLILEKSGCYCFLEANVSGQWGVVEAHAGYPIAEAIVRRLAYA